ncbi:hypothetical protein CRYUN_Cryun12cG0102200 [Craigia yunnanensis]
MVATDMAHEEKKLKLYSYGRSSCSFRIRIALNLKGLNYQYIPVSLLKEEQFNPEFQRLNPIGYVPMLVDGEIIISDSFAIFKFEEGFEALEKLLKDHVERYATGDEVFLADEKKRCYMAPWRK